MVVRTCGWCDVDISDKRSNAQYCCTQHKKNAAATRFRERNPGYYARYSKSEARLSYNAENAEKRREESRVRMRERRERDPEGARTRAAEWWAANPERHRHYQMKRRVSKIDNPHSVGVAEEDWLKLVARCGGKCFYCGVKPTKALHMDHVIPLVRGGRHAIGNILPACPRCNQRKNRSLLMEWKRREAVDGGRQISTR